MSNPGFDISQGFASRLVLVRRGDEVIAGVRTKTVNFNGEAIDTTSDENDGWQTKIPTYGVRGVSLQVEGVVKGNVLKNAWATQDVINDMTMEWPDGWAVNAAFAFNNYVETGANDGEMTFTCTFESSGEVAIDPGEGSMLLLPSLTTLPGATEDEPYSFEFEVKGGTAPHEFVVTAGALPTGLSLATDGTLSGTPTDTGVFVVQVSVTDDNDLVASNVYSLAVSEA